VAGGDIHQAFRVELDDGRQAFVKTHEYAPPGMFSAEARGLSFLRAATTSLAIPEVLAVAQKPDGAALLALSWLQRVVGSAAHEEALGRGLAQLHSFSLADRRYGLPRHNFIALLPQDNTPSESWVEFYIQRRLEPMIARAHAAGTMPSSLAASCRALFDKLPTLLANEDPPAALHGDLWGGNAMFTSQGPAIYDPAAYVGHREVDLAMMHLFGGFSSRCFAAYQEAYPLSVGHEERRPIYQLYPLLVHVNLFGESYARQVAGIVQRYG